MSISAVHPVMGPLTTSVFQGLRQMDEACPTGLNDFAQLVGLKGKDEPGLTFGITQQLIRAGYAVDQCERHYPGQEGKKGARRTCDRFIRLADGSRVWLELKLAWRCWYYGQVKWNNEFHYKGYLFGPDWGPDKSRRTSVAQDIDKLQVLTRDDADFVSVLVVGFDADDSQMVADMAQLAVRAELTSRGWVTPAPACWPARQSSSCWNRCWFWWKKV